MKTLNSRRTTRTFDPLVLPQGSGVLHYSDGHCGDLGSEPLSCSINSGMVFGHWAALEMQVNACGGAEQGTKLPLRPVLISSLLGKSQHCLVCWPLSMSWCNRTPLCPKHHAYSMHPPQGEKIVRKLEKTEIQCR